MASENTLKYVKLDYQSHRDSLLQRVRSRWSLSWNDFLANNFGRVLVDLIAYATSTLAYVINRAAAENFISTMTLRESAVRVGALVSYKLRNPVAASVLCDAKINSAVSEAINLAKGTSISVPITGGTVIYELADSYLISVGATEPSELILTIDPLAAGDSVVNSQFTAIAGNDYIDLADSTVNLADYVSAGQYVTCTSNSLSYRIVSITTSATGQSQNRLIIDPVWTALSSTAPSGTIDQFSATVTERRVRFNQGQTFVETATVPPVETPNYSIKLSRYPVIDSSVIVTVDGELWPTISTLALEDGDSRTVETKTLADGSSSVLFGDGIFGAMPPSSATISITYRAGGGAVGNVEAGTINCTVIGKQLSGQQTVQITNSWTPGTGGVDVETLAEARNNIPAYVRTNSRGVTAEDYQTLATNYSDPIQGQVRYAKAMTSVSNSLLEGNVVKIYAWTTGPSGGLIPLPAGLKGSLTSYLRTKTIGTDYVTLLDGTQRPAAIAVRFKVFTGFDITTVHSSVTTKLNQIITANKPGDPINFSDMVKQLDSLNGVAALTVATPLSDLTPATETEILTPPDSTYTYSLELKSITNYTYESQLPMAPLTAWCVKIYAGGRELLVVPDTTPGRARIIGDSTLDGIANYSVGLAASKPVTLTASMAGDFYYATDTALLYRADLVGGSLSTLYWNPVTTGGSYLDLYTGKLVISFKGTQKAITAKLITAQGYEVERSVNVYVNYTGENNAAKRQEIRTALKTWANGFKIGGSIFTTAIRGAGGAILLAASRSNITDVVLTVAGIAGVNRVNLENPSNSVTRLDAAATELIKLGSISLNGNLS